MLKVVHNGSALPVSMPLEPTAEFEAGQFAQLTIIGNDIKVTVSDGTAPIGIIDDVRKSSFSRPQIDEIVYIPVRAVELNDNNERVNVDELSQALDFPNIIDNTFTSTLSVILNKVNGIITVPAGTPLNHDANNDGLYDSFKIIVSYAYRIPGYPGDDSTVGSNRVSLWYARGFYATDQYDTLEVYPLNCTLYVGLDGKLTSRQPTENHPGIAICTGPPTSPSVNLEFMYL